MLSYLHGFHAGNFADVHKHWILSLLLRHVIRKPSAVSYLETHAGRGRYDLASAEADKTGEYLQGIARLWAPAHSTPLDEPLAPYVDTVRAFNPDGTLRHYPGSPLIAQHLLREQDRLILMEAHPAEHRALKQSLAADPRAAVHHRDGYEGLGAFVPARTPRLLVLIDPSYEDKDEYRQAPAELLQAWQRARHGIYALWYPLLSAARHHALLTAIQNRCTSPVLRSELHTRAADSEGMTGSGMLVVNPPWQLDTTLQQYGPVLARRLAERTGCFNCDWLVEEGTATSS